MDENRIRQIIQEEISRAAQEAQYSVTCVPTHTHNNIDSPNVPQHGVVGFEAFDGIANGVANPTLLQSQNLNFGDVIANLGGVQRMNVYQYPIPIIYGDGTPTAATLTGTPSSGAKSATLTGNWAGASGAYAAKFDNNEIRVVTLTSGAATVTWTYPLQIGAVGTGLSVIGDSRFHGGTAIFGTMLIFRNDADGIMQLWVRTDSQSIAERWAYVNLTLNITD